MNNPSMFSVSRMISVAAVATGSGRSRRQLLQAAGVALLSVPLVVMPQALVKKPREVTLDEVDFHAPHSLAG